MVLILFPQVDGQSWSAKGFVTVCEEMAALLVVFVFVVVNVALAGFSEAA